MKSITADLLMLLTGVIWGLGFVACQYSINSGMPAPLILFLRFGISAIVMIIIFYKKIITITKEEFKLGMLAGIFLFCAFFCQTVGLQNTVLSNNAFITSTDVILVPFITWVIFNETQGQFDTQRLVEKVKIPLLLLCSFAEK